MPEPSGETPAKDTKSITRRAKTASSNGEQDRLSQSFEAALRAARSAPDSDEAWDHVEDLADALQRPDDVASAYRDLLGGQLDPELRHKLGQRAVRFHDEWFGDNPEAMVTLLSYILERDAGARWAFERITMILTSAERWDDLLGVYDQVLANTGDPELRKTLLHDAAQVAKDFALRPDRAVDYMQMELQLDPANAKLAAAIERLLERQGRWDDLIALWQARIPDLGAAEARSARLRVARVHLDHLDAAGPALEELRALVEEAPGHDEACRELERILASDRAPAPIRMQALSLLRTNYEAAGRGGDVVVALERALEFADGAERLALHREAGNRLGILGRDEEALSHYAALLRSEPSDADARRQLRQLARRSQLHALQVDALVAAAEAAEPAQKAALLLEAAHGCRLELEDADRAIDLYARVVELAEHDPTLGLSAAHQLGELLAAAGRTKERLDVLERLAELEQSSAVRRAVLGEAGHIADALGDHDRALAAYERRLSFSERDIEALDAYVELLARCERWEPLVEALLRRAQITLITQQRRADLVRVARLQAETLDRLPEAIDTWLKVREEFGDEEETIVALDDLLSKAMRFDELVPILDQAGQTRRAQAAHMLARLGEIHQAQLGRPDLAVRYYAHTLGVDPTKAHARAGLRELMELDACAAPAVAALVSAYRETGDWKDLLEITETRLRAATDTRAAVEVLREAAELYEHRGEDPNAALTAMARALVLDPDNIGIEQDVMRLAEATGDWSAAADALASAAAEASTKPKRAAQLRRDEGRIREEIIGDPAGALAAYAAASRLEPDDLRTRRAVIRAAARAQSWEEATPALVAICTARQVIDADALSGVETAARETGAWAAMLDAMGAAIDAGDMPALLARDLEVQRSRWYAEHVGDLDAAEQAASRAAERDPDHRETLALLAELQRRHPGRALVETLVKIDGLAERDLDALREAADVAVSSGEESMWIRDVVARLYRKAARLLARDEEILGEHSAPECALWALEQLVSMDVETGRRAQAIDALLAAAELPLSRDEKLDLRVRAARLCVEAGDRAHAIDLYRHVLEERRDDIELVVELATLCEQDGRLLELVAMRGRELELTTDLERRLALRLDISRLVGELEKRDGRVPALERNLDEQPGHAPSIDALTEVLEEKGQFERLADILTAQAERLQEAGDATRAAELWMRLATLVETRLSDVERAIAALEHVVELAPSNDALDALARLYLVQEDPARAAKVLERRLETTDAAGRVSVLLRLARAEIQAGDESRAIETLRAAFEGAPRSGEIRKLLFKLYRDHEQWERLADALTVATEHVTDRETILAYAREAASIFHRRLRAPERAVPVLERAYALSPDDRTLRSQLAEGLRIQGRLDEGRRLLEGLIADFGRRRSPDRAQAHLQLARVAHAQGDIAEAIDQLERASTMDAGNPDILDTLASMAREAGQLDRAERAYRTLLLQVRRAPTEDIGPARVLFELGRIAAERGDTDQAEELQESVLEALAENDAEGPHLQALLQERGEVDFLCRVLEARLRHASDPRRRAEVHAARAEVRQRSLGDPRGAFEDLTEAVKADPGSPPLHEQACRLASELGCIDDYIALLEDLLEKARRNTDVYVRCELLLRLADLLQNEREDLERAAELVEQAEATGVREIDVWRAAARLAAARGDTDTQMRYLQRLAELGEEAAETRADALFRMAEVQLAAGEVDRGLAILGEALEVDSRWERAARILGRAAEELGQHAELLALYDKVARKTGDKATLLAAIEKRATHPDTAPEDLEEGVRLAIELEQPERAEALMLRAVEMAESLLDGERRIAWALLGLAERRKESGDLAAAVKWSIEAIGAAEPAKIHALAKQVADASAEPGGDLTLPVKLYEALLEHDASAPEVWQPLAELYRKLGDLDRLHRLVEETLDSLDTAAARNALRLELAQTLLDHPGREQDASDLLRNILLETPEHAEAQRMLVELLERQGDDQELVDLLRQQLMVAQERKDRGGVVRCTLRLARKVVEQDPADARAILRSALEWAPDDVEILRALLELLDGEDDAFERTEIVERLIGVETEDEAARMAIELADAYAASGDEEGELRALALGYRRAPASATLRARLQASYEQRGDHRGLAEMLLTTAEAESDPALAVTMLRQAAAIHAETLFEPHAAAEILERARAVAPEDTPLGLELASALAAAGDTDRATQMVSTLLDDPFLDPGMRLQVLSTRGILRSTAGDLDGAVEDFEAALSGGGDVGEHLVEALERRREAAARGGDTELERVTTLRMVSLLTERDERERARTLLSGWIERERKDTEALRLLREIDTADERWDAVAKTCGRLVAIETGERQVDAALALSDACQRMGKPEEARAGLEHARRKQPDNADLRRELRRIYELTGADQELARLLLQEADDAPSPEERLEILRRATDLLVAVGDVQAALPGLQEILTASPGDIAASITLADAYMASGQVDDADVVLDRAIAEAGNRRTPELGMLYHRKARVAGHRRDPQTQLALLQQAFACDKNNGYVAAELADLAEMLEAWDLAVRVLRTITLIDTECPISRAQAFLRQAQICFRRGDRQRAVLWAKKAQHESPQDVEIHTFLTQLGEA